MEVFTDLRGGRFYNADCFEVMKTIKPGTFDMVLCDLPYGTTYAKWDSALPLGKLWEEYCRVVKDGCAIVLTCSQPFTSKLLMSNPDLFRHAWVWDKVNAANFANANVGPLKQHEDILVFGKGKVNYYPQKYIGDKNHVQGKKSRTKASATMLISERAEDDTSGMKFPKSIIQFAKHSSQVKIHPTQKPVALFEYLIRTYTNEGAIVLDNTAGSGTTAIAAINSKRRWVCIEKDEGYYNAAVERIRNHAVPENP